MTKRRLDSFLNRYIEIAKISEAPSYMHFWAGVSLLASVVQRKVYLNMGTFEYIPNFYIIFVASPGIATKSVTIAPVAAFLRQFAKQGIYLSKASTTWQEFIQSFAQATTSVAYPEDGGLRTHYNAISIMASELGTFLDFSNADLINHLTELWDGRRGKFEKGTKTQGNDIIFSPVLNLLGGTTPAWIENNFETFMIGSGFTSRTIFIYANEKSQFIPYPDKLAKSIGFDIVQWHDDLLYDLRIISKLCGKFELTQEATDYGEELYIQIQTKLANGGLSDDLQGFYARKQGHIHKLAMLLAISERSDLSLDRYHLETAEQIISGAESSRTETLSTVGQTRESKIIADIRRALAQTEKIEIRVLWKRLVARADRRTIENALMTGIHAGYWIHQGLHLIGKERKKK